MDQDPVIEFREDKLGRRAAVRRGPDVWEIVRIQQQYGDKPEVVRAAFPELRRKEVEAALRYWKNFPESVELFLIEYDRRQLWDKMDHLARMGSADMSAAFALKQLEAKQAAADRQEEAADPQALE